MTAQTVTMVTAILGVVLAASSLSWQAATFHLTGGRARIELRAGARNARSFITMPVAQFTPESLQSLAAQGYQQPVIGVQVRNIGRQPITVQSWNLRHPAGLSLTSHGDVIGKPLPHRLDVGQCETWVMEGGQVAAFIEAADAIRPAESPESATWVDRVTARMEDRRGEGGVRAVVELGDGRSLVSRERLPTT